jgi:hypothetical protein
LCRDSFTVIWKRRKKKKEKKKEKKEKKKGKKGKNGNKDKKKEKKKKEREREKRGWDNKNMQKQILLNWRRNRQTICSQDCLVILWQYFILSMSVWFVCLCLMCLHHTRSAKVKGYISPAKKHSKKIEKLFRVVAATKQATLCRVQTVEFWRAAWKCLDGAGGGSSCPLN